MGGNEPEIVVVDTRGLRVGVGIAEIVSVSSVGWREARIGDVSREILSTNRDHQSSPFDEREQKRELTLTISWSS